MRIEERNPNVKQYIIIQGIILTEFSRDDFLFYKNGSAIYETPPQIDKVTEESILGRQMLLKFFQNDFKHNLKFIFSYLGIIRISETILYQKWIKYTEENQDKINNLSI